LTLTGNNKMLVFGLLYTSSEFFALWATLATAALMHSEVLILHWQIS